MTPPDERTAWAASGAMSLTGRPDGPPLDAPDGFVGRLRAVGETLARSSGELGRRVDVDVLALLGERAALAGLHRGGDVSCGGAARLLPTADGWLAVNLPRPDDVALLPAWLAEASAPPDEVSGGAGPDAWAALAAAVASGSAEPLAERAQLLGLPVAALPRPGEVGPVAAAPPAGLPVVGTRLGGDAGPGPVPPLEGLLVADLSSLWAGPLCTQLLQQAGARVVKVESIHRPDGARRGPAAFFDLLHAGQEAVALDFGTEDGRADLCRLLGSAAVIVEGSRPRALEQLGIVADHVLAAADRTGAGPSVWVSITGYGRAAPGRDRVAFGDDAAAAGGLVVWDEAGPCFLADAVADPCSGLVAAAAVLRALAAGGRWLLDVSMRAVAAHLAGPGASAHPPLDLAKRDVAAHLAGPGASAHPPLDLAKRDVAAHMAGPGAVGEKGGLVAELPRARAAPGRGPRLGEHTEAVLAEVHRR